ncbi:MAG: O-antigen ligase family protein [Bacteroidota bacterium]
MSENKKIFWISAISILYVIINSFLTLKEFFWLNLLPVVIGIVLLALVRLDILFFLIVFFVPLSIPLREIMSGLDFDFFLPTEPMMFGVMLLFYLKLLTDWNIDRRIMNHPVTLAILLNVAWLFITTLTSTMPAVSTKFLFARLWFLTVFYFLAIRIFRDPRNMIRFYWFYIIPLLGVVLFTLYRQYSFGYLDYREAHKAMRPFYNDHTIYGAAIAMYIPIVFGLLWMNIKKRWEIVVFGLGVAFLLVLALIFSYSRAAWLSIIGAMGVAIILVFRIKIGYLIILAMVVLMGILSQWNHIIMQLEKNTDESSSSFTEHVKSISNIGTDASNMERINRWKSAFRMFDEKPVFGFGPGTYQFQYAPYQRYRDKTIISTNFGTVGNAHSEYIGPLAESGVPGTLTFLLIVILSTITGVKVFKKARSINLRIIALVSLLGLVTYFLHGFLNNFLDTDKASAPFWGFIAILVAIDLYYTNYKSKNIVLPKEDLNR